MTSGLDDRSVAVNIFQYASSPSLYSEYFPNNASQALTASFNQVLAVFCRFNSV